MNEPGQKIQAAVAGIIARRAPSPVTSPGDKIVEMRALLRRVQRHGLSHPIGLCDLARPRCSRGLRDLLAAIDAELTS